jgi:hypothetical protein
MHGRRNLFSIPHFKTGLALVLISWTLNWSLPSNLRPAAFLFFPLWLGYALMVDALTVARTGTSIFTRSRRNFAWLFIASAPAWWLFELINLRTQNWEYPGAEVFGPFTYFLLCTVAFSTVMPAVFGTAELVRSATWMQRFTQGPRIQPSRTLAVALFVAGAAMLTAALLWPQVCYPLVWGSVFLLLEPLNILLQRRNLFHHLQHGDWRPVVALALGSLACGFFWEMWNFYSYPKWIYHTPGAEFLHIFEMPLLGYLGYIPFAWELFSLHNLISPKPSGPAL